MENKIIHSTAQRLADRINKYTNKEGLELLKMVLGIEVFIINVSKLIIIYSLSALLGILEETFIAHIAFVVIKRHSFGLHALNSSMCTLCSVCMFVLFPYLLNGAEADRRLVMVVFIAVIFILYKYAPADTKARPIIGKHIRALLKRKAVAWGIILMIAALLSPNGSVRSLLTLGAVCQSVFILPLTYKILKRSEKNYEEYERNAWN